MEWWSGGVGGCPGPFPVEMLVKVLDVFADRSATITLGDVPVDRVGRSNRLSGNPLHFERLRLKQPTGVDVQRDRIFPNPQLLIAAIPILFLHHSITPSLPSSIPHYSTTPPLHPCNPPLLHLSSQATAQRDNLRSPNPRVRVSADIPSASGDLGASTAKEISSAPLRSSCPRAGIDASHHCGSCASGASRLKLHWAISCPAADTRMLILRCACVRNGCTKAFKIRPRSVSEASLKVTSARRLTVQTPQHSVSPHPSRMT